MTSRTSTTNVSVHQMGFRVKNQKIYMQRKNKVASAHKVCDDGISSALV